MHVGGRGMEAVNVRRARWSPFQMVCIVLFGAFAVAMVVGAVVSAVYSESMRHRGVEVEATVTADSEQAKGGYCDVRFADVAGTVWDVHLDSSCGVSVGHEVSVVYDPQNPDDVDFSKNLDAGNIVATSAFFVFLGLVFGAVSVWSLRASRERFGDINRRWRRWRAPDHRPTSHRRDQ
ncbi:hypothetical protein KDL01_41270 [Actinospica durhamensis]|uniref:DUF3592 domain-containing protein n=1 Tax=Actinospica durhamensis TaxID=1508375 RepID=A0A941F1S7_9ACTN|nr:DUF3592 domain-containing protein [Actinospica durhamensis]MBR7839749.1 hypothetical protein [Actinospica durhamensis]